MAFSAEAATMPPALWLLYLATVVWIVVYDTFYAMVDRADDLQAGVKSTAILFGTADRVICAVLQLCFILSMVVVGRLFGCGPWFYLGLAVAAGLSVYQQFLVRDRRPEACFRAFLNNSYVGMAIFAGLALDYGWQD
jgi:4-hydroxybenzoate polyprenyltransferase